MFFLNDEMDAALLVYALGFVFQSITIIKIKFDVRMPFSIIYHYYTWYNNFRIGCSLNLLTIVVNLLLAQVW